MIPLKKILVPVDFSEEAALALEWAVALVKEQPGASITLLHTPNVDPYVDGEFGLPVSAEPLRERARHDLNNWKVRIPSSVSVAAILGVSSPLEDIVTLAAEEDIDLIVMTTSGRRGLARLMTPNLTERVIRRAPCPVMALHINPKTRRMVQKQEGSPAIRQ